jgi:hypothetical protein
MIMAFWAFFDNVATTCVCGFFRQVLIYLTNIGHISPIEVSLE